jgi:hypothetical protein
MKKVRKRRKKRKHILRKIEERKIALERIKILEEMKKKKPEFAERYDEIIAKIKKKYKIKFR